MSRAPFAKSSFYLSFVLSAFVGPGCVRETNNSDPGQDMVSSGGSSGGSAGASVSSGGVTQASGGMTQASGGSTDASGGTSLSSGGSGDAQGGTSNAGGGASTSSGGAGSSSDEMVDNLEDGDGRIPETSGRRGPWHIFNNSSGSGNQTPTNNQSATILPDTGGANATQRAIHTSGSGYEFAGTGFDLNNPDSVPESGQSQAWSASAFTGVAFYVKGKAKLRVELPTKNFVPVARGGSCNEGSETCWNVYGSRLSASQWDDWQEVRIRFSQLERQEGGTNPAFDASLLMSISFKHEGTEAFDFWIDEVRLIKD